MKLQKHGGYLLSELMISLSVFTAVSIGLLMGFVSLERNFAATTDFATNHADQMRISDYLALDLRRALTIQPAQNDTMISIPAYYDSNGAPQIPALDGAGGVYYGSKGSSISVRYYLLGETIYRREGVQAPVPVAENVKDFVFDISDLGKVVTTRITFNPTFSAAGPSAATTSATAFYNTTLLRNSRTDIVSAVY